MKEIKEVLQVAFPGIAEKNTPKLWSFDFLNKGSIINKLSAKFAIHVTLLHCWDLVFEVKRIVFACLSAFGFPETFLDEEAYLNALGDVAVQVDEVAQDAVGEQGGHQQAHKVDVPQSAFFEKVSDDQSNANSEGVSRDAIEVQ